MFTYVVAGMKRTGTSMMMECLEKGGLEICWDKERDGKVHLEQPNNPNIHFYELDVPEAAWLPLAPYKGKCVKLMGTRCLGRKAAPLKVLYIARDPEARAHSLWAACGEMKGRSYYDRLRTQHVKELSVSDEIDTLSILDYDDVLKHPLKSFCALRNDGWPIDPVKAASGVNPELKHY